VFILATGAKILSAIKIGINASIGANAVVLTNIPNNSIAVGIPARIVPRK
jgi:serine O-acetyltransferase